MPDVGALSESREDCLETIYHLVLEHKVARVKGIARRMGLHKSTVSGGLKSLAECGLVEHESYGLVTLTPQGEELARELVRRHEILRRFFTNLLGLDADSAGRNACQIEHAIEPEALRKLVDFMENTWPGAAAKSRDTHACE